MRVLLLNDTSSFHSGCKAAMDSLSSRILQAGHEFVARIPRLQYPDNKQIRDCQILIVNGEGFMRGEIDGMDLDRQKRTRETMAFAARLRKRIFLVNTVWWRQSKAWERVLKSCEGISVREPDSAQAMHDQFGLDPEIHPDESWFYPVRLSGIQPWDRILTYIGRIQKENMDDGSTETSISLKFSLPLFLDVEPWQGAIETLESATLYITGQHHGVYAAIKARCPFIACRVKTHKITGLFRWAEVDVPIATSITDIMRQLHAGSNTEQCNKLHDFLDKQQPWPIPA